MNNHIKNIVFYFLFIFIVFQANAQSSYNSGDDAIKMVNSYGDNLNNWCRTDDIKFLNNLLNIVGGAKSCRIDDGIMKLFAKANTDRLLKGDMTMETFFNCIQNAIDKNNFEFEHGTPQIASDYQAPTLFNDDTNYKYITMPVTTKGEISFNGEDLFIIENNQVVGVHDNGAGTTIGRALKEYSAHNYKEAFRIFRTLAYANPTDYEAQYYTTVMEIKKQGCNDLSSEIRDIEAAWWLYRAAKAYQAGIKTKHTELMVRCIQLFSVKFNKLACNEITKYASNGLVFYKGKNGKFGYMNEKGKKITDAKYTACYPFGDNGLAGVSEDGRNYGFIDKLGNVVVPLKYKAISQYYINGSAVVQDYSGNLLRIDIHGDVLEKIGSNYKELYPTILVGKYLSAMTPNNQWHIFDFYGNVIDRTPNIVQDPNRYRLWVEYNGKFNKYYQYGW